MDYKHQCPPGAEHLRLLTHIEQEHPQSTTSTCRRYRFWEKIIFSDEAHFDLGGYVCKQAKL